MTLPEMFFFKGSNNSFPVHPTRTIALSDSHRTVQYSLRGIIYSGGYHFSARMIDDNDMVWKYDGRVNRGFPMLEGPLGLTFLINPSLLMLDGRTAYLFLFCKAGAHGQN